MEDIIEELTKVSPDKLSKEGLKLFEKINEIIDKNKELEADLYASDCIVKEQIDIISNSVSKDEIKEKIEELENTPSRYPYIQQHKIEVLQELLNKGE